MEHRTSFFNEQSDVSFLCCIFAVIMLNWVSCVLKPMTSCGADVGVVMHDGIPHESE